MTLQTDQSAHSCCSWQCCQTTRMAGTLTFEGSKFGPRTSHQMLEQEDCPCSPVKSFSSKLLSDDKMPVHFCVICQVSVLVLCESFDGWCTHTHKHTHTHIMVDMFLSDKKLQTLFTYWVIQQSWFAQVNALCNLLRKKS